MEVLQTSALPLGYGAWTLRDARPRSAEAVEASPHTVDGQQVVRLRRRTVKRLVSLPLHPERARRYVHLQSLSPHTPPRTASPHPLRLPASAWRAMNPAQG